MMACEESAIMLYCYSFTHCGNCGLLPESDKNHVLYVLKRI